MTKERILCSAIWYKDGKQYPYQPKNITSGYVLFGWRHKGIESINLELTGKITRPETSVYGFLTSTNSFVDRVEGNLIAINAHQVFGNEVGDELISEDLY